MNLFRKKKPAQPSALIKTLLLQTAYAKGLDVARTTGNADAYKISFSAHVGYEQHDAFRRGIADGFTARAETDEQFVPVAIHYGGADVQGRIIDALQRTDSQDYAASVMQLFAYAYRDVSKSGPFEGRSDLRPLQRAAEQAVCRTRNAGMAAQYNDAYRAAAAGEPIGPILAQHDVAAAKAEWLAAITDPHYQTKEARSYNPRARSFFDPRVEPAKRLGWTVGNAVEALDPSTRDTYNDNTTNPAAPPLSGIRVLMNVGIYPVDFPARIRKLPNHVLAEMDRHMGDPNGSEFPTDARAIKTLINEARGMKPNTAQDYLAAGGDSMREIAAALVKDLPDAELARLLAEYKPF